MERSLFNVYDVIEIKFNISTWMHLRDENDWIYFNGR